MQLPLEVLVEIGDHLYSWDCVSTADTLLSIDRRIKKWCAKHVIFQRRKRLHLAMHRSLYRLFRVQISRYLELICGTGVSSRIPCTVPEIHEISLNELFLWVSAPKQAIGRAVFTAYPESVFFRCLRAWALSDRLIQFTYGLGLGTEACESNWYENQFTNYIKEFGSKITGWDPSLSNQKRIDDYVYPILHHYRRTVPYLGIVLHDFLESDDYPHRNQRKEDDPDSVFWIVVGDDKPTHHYATESIGVPGTMTDTEARTLAHWFIADIPASDLFHKIYLALSCDESGSSACSPDRVFDAGTNNNNNNNNNNNMPKKTDRGNVVVGDSDNTDDYNSNEEINSERDEGWYYPARAMLSSKYARACILTELAEKRGATYGAWDVPFLFQEMRLVCMVGSSTNRKRFVWVYCSVMPTSAEVALSDPRYTLNNLWKSIVCNSSTDSAVGIETRFNRCTTEKADKSGFACMADAIECPVPAELMPVVPVPWFDTLPTLCDDHRESFIGAAGAAHFRTRRYSPDNNTRLCDHCTKYRKLEPLTSQVDERIQSQPYNDPKTSENHTDNDASIANNNRGNNLNGNSNNDNHESDIATEDTDTDESLDNDWRDSCSNYDSYCGTDTDNNNNNSEDSDDGSDGYDPTMNRDEQNDNDDNDNDTRTNTCSQPENEYEGATIPLTFPPIPSCVPPERWMVTSTAHNSLASINARYDRARPWRKSVPVSIDYGHQY